MENSRRGKLLWRIQKEENCFWRFALRRIKTGALLREFNNIGECSDFDPSFSERRGPYYLYYQIKIVQGGVANSKSPLCAPQSRKVGPDILS